MGLWCSVSGRQCRNTGLRTSDRGLRNHVSAYDQIVFRMLSHISSVIPAMPIDSKSMFTAALINTTPIMLKRIRLAATFAVVKRTFVMVYPLAFNRAAIARYVAMSHIKRHMSSRHIEVQQIFFQL